MQFQMAENETTDIEAQLSEWVKQWQHSGLESVTMAGRARDEIKRLRGWLRYIEGRFAPADECAARALSGEPVPGEFASWPK